MSGTADGTAQRSTAAAAASEQASASEHTVAAAAEEHSASIEEIGKRASNSSTIAAQASQTARTTHGQHARLPASAQKIANVVRLCPDLANQTNLLPLNTPTATAPTAHTPQLFAPGARKCKHP